MTIVSGRQRADFQARGLVRVPGLLRADAIAPARAQLHAVLERAGVFSDGAWTGERTADWSFHSSLMQRLKPCAKSGNFQAVLPAEVWAIAEALAGEAVSCPYSKHPQILFTPPNADTWTVPGSIWHVDLPRLGELGPPGVQMFSFLDTVEPGGGGTLVVAGSHRLVNDSGRVRSKDVKKRLSKTPFFRCLLRGEPEERARLLEERGSVGEVELQVVELCGEPGDVYFTDLRLLHTLAPNASARPRLMVTQRFFVDRVIGALGKPQAA